MGSKAERRKHVMSLEIFRLETLRYTMFLKGMKEHLTSVDDYDEDGAEDYVADQHMLAVRIDELIQAVEGNAPDVEEELKERARP